MSAYGPGNRDPERTDAIARRRAQGHRRLATLGLGAGAVLFVLTVVLLVGAIRAVW